MAGKYKKLKKPVHCPNALGIYPTAKEGSLIRFKIEMMDHSVEYKLGRVLGLATHDGCMKEYTAPKKRGGTKPSPKLLVLQANDMLRFAYEMHVDPADVVETVEPNEHGSFAKWFLAGKMPSFEVVLRASEHGVLSDSYFDQYMDDEGNLPEDYDFKKRVR